MPSPADIADNDPDYFFYELERLAAEIQEASAARFDVDSASIQPAVITGLEPASHWDVELECGHRRATTPCPFDAPPRLVDCDRCGTLAARVIVAAPHEKQSSVTSLHLPWKT